MCRVCLPFCPVCILFCSIPGAELFISGESYAGFYIPWIAEHIVRSQLVPNARGELVRNVDLGECSASLLCFDQFISTTQVHHLDLFPFSSLDGINLSGVAIGNGVMDMLTQVVFISLRFFYLFLFLSLKEEVSTFSLSPHEKMLLNHHFILSQEPSYAEYAYYHGLIPLGAKLKFDEDWKVCLKKVNAVLYIGFVFVHNFWHFPL